MILSCTTPDSTIFSHRLQHHFNPLTVLTLTTKLLIAEGELHSVELRLKSQRKRGKKIAAAVYEYLADCGGKWGEISYNFKDDTADILLLAEWDTMVSHRFAMRTIEYLREHSRDALLDKIVLTFIGLEQKSHYLGYI